MLYVYLIRRPPHCWYSAAGAEYGAHDATAQRAAGPFATMAECDAWIAGQGRARGVPWLC